MKALPSGARSRNPYWYLRRRIGTRINERYLGAETPQLLGQIARLKVQSRKAKDAVKGLYRPPRASMNPQTRRLATHSRRLKSSSRFQI